jgi:uncharacterized membrane protein
MEEPAPPARRAFRTAVVLSVVAAAPALLMLTEHTPWAWLAPFLGRYHPVVLHFPVALLILAGLLEVIRTASPGARQFPLSFVMFFASASAVTAMALGWLLMHADAVKGPLIHRHMQGGIAVAILSVLTLFACVLAEAGAGRKAALWIYRGLLIATCALLVRTAHDGGMVTHGEDYLDEYAPWHKAKPHEAFQFPVNKPLAQWDIYAHVVAPILQDRCYECHGTKNVKGGLELGTWAAIQRGGKDGPVLSAGEPEKSLLYQRINLPLEHTEHMPPRRRAQPSPEELALIRRWIALGAPEQGTLAAVHLDSRLLSVVAELPALLSSGAVATESPDSREIDYAAVAKLRSGLAAAVARLQAKYPNIITYESRQSADLCLDAAPLGEKFGDGDVAALAPLHDRIVWADLSGTAVTDGSALGIGAMKGLRVLKLANTAITDSFVPALASLRQLETLNIYDTSVTPAAMSGLERLHAIRRIYVASTKIPTDTPLPESIRGKLIFANAVAPVLELPNLIPQKP